MTDILHRLHCTIRCDIETAASGCHCAEARDEITALRAEHERLRAALKTISDMTDYGTETATWRMTNVIHNTNVIARAALDGQPAQPQEEA